MKLNEFLKLFPPFVELFKLNQQIACKLLNEGHPFRNDAKYRLEFLQFDDISSINNMKNPKAWISYEALEKNPRRIFLDFCNHRLNCGGKVYIDLAVKINKRLESK